MILISLHDLVRSKLSGQGRCKGVLLFVCLFSKEAKSWKVWPHFTFSPVQQISLKLLLEWPFVQPSMCYGARSFLSFLHAASAIPHSPGNSPSLPQGFETPFSFFGISQKSGSDKIWAWVSLLCGPLYSFFMGKNVRMIVCNHSPVYLSGSCYFTDKDKNVVMRGGRTCHLKGR